MNLSIVLSTQPAQFQAVAFKGNLEKNLSHIARLGYDGVELAVRDPKLVDPDQLETLLRKYGLSVPAIGTGQAWGEEKLSFTSDNADCRRSAIERIKSHIPLAARFHALIIIGLIRGITPKGQSHAVSLDYLVECLKECAAEAALDGVRLALEPINRYETDLIANVEEGLSLLERVEADNLGLLLDTFHMNIEEAVIEKSIQVCGSHIFHFHVADSNRWYPGAGHLDFKSILSTLQQTGYPGYISGEFLPQPDAETSAQKNLAYLRTLSFPTHYFS